MTRARVFGIAASKGYPAVKGIRAGAAAWRAFALQAGAAELLEAWRLLNALAARQGAPTSFSKVGGTIANGRQFQDGPSVRTPESAGGPQGVGCHAPGPTPEHWHEVVDAIAKFTGAGKYERIGAGLILPDFTLVWDDPHLKPHQLGAVGVHTDGGLTIYLRSDLTPEQCHRTMIHELTHCHDHQFFAPLPDRQDPVFEGRAQWMVQALAWL